MEVNFLLLVSTLFEFSIFEARALKNMHIIVPEVVRRGSNITLICNYDLESVPLYSIKWYKDEEEFYRYVPKESPPAQQFQVVNVNVDSQIGSKLSGQQLAKVRTLQKLSQSNSSRVSLTSVERETSGEFKCEVSADAPFFHTDIGSARLLVAEIPEDEPVLKVEVQKLAPGAYLRANCTTPGSYPTMNITWKINDKEIYPWNFNGVTVEENSFRDVANIEKSIFRFDALPGLETVQSTFSMKTRSDLFDKGKLRLRCSASMFTLYKAFREAEVQEDAPKLALVIDGQKDQRSGGDAKRTNLEESKILGFLLLLLSSFVSNFLRIQQTFK